MIGRTIITLAALMAAAPALAQSGASVSEPSDALLFGLGFAGLIIGRWAARHKPGD